MTAIALDLLSAAMMLPEGDRLELAAKLLASVDREQDADWNQSWLDELDRREQAVADGGDPGSSWADAKARISARLAAG